MSHDPFTVRDIRGNSTGVYFTLTTATKGAIGTTATVTVKHSTQHDKYVCLTCLSNNCTHTRFVAGLDPAAYTIEKAS